MISELSTLFMHRDAVSRSLSAENQDGRPGGGGRATSETTLHPPSAHAARELGPPWKMSPCISVEAGETVTLMNHEGPGFVRHIWMTFSEKFYRSAVLRVFYDHQQHPSIEVPLGDFFCNGWDARQNILAQPINVNPTGGMNVYLPMPFKTHIRITVENQAPELMAHLFYQIDYTLETVPEEALYLHANWTRSNPLQYMKLHTILDNVSGRGQFVGVFMTWQQNSPGWWGEGEVKMYIDDDESFPTICGTGTEDYFGGAWCFKENYSAPYLGYQKVSGKDVGARMTMYRFHVLDPIFFKSRIKIDVQALGWQSEGRYLPLSDDISSVAYWYQSMPSNRLAPLPRLSARVISHE